MHSSPEFPTTEQTFTPITIREMIDDGMTPIQLSQQTAQNIPASDLPDDIRFGGTDIYSLDADPNIIVRHNSDGESYKYTLGVAEAFNRLPQYGINSLPYSVIDHNGETLVLTTRVSGEPLLDLLQNNPGHELIDAVDKNWANLTDMTVAALETDKLMPQDIDAPHQYILGTTPDDDTSKLRMFDLGEYAHAISSETGSFEYNLAHIADEIVGIEEVSGTKLTLARERLQAALEQFQPKNYRAEQYHVIAKHILTNNERVDLGDDEQHEEIWAEHDFKHI